MEPVAPMISPDHLKAMFADGGELALIDVRDLGPFSAGHLWPAVNIPMSRLETSVMRTVPRATTRIILCDEDGVLAENAACALGRIGYDDVSILEGGIRRCQEHGWTMVEGNYVVAHAFGFFLQEEYRIPLIDAETLKLRIDRHENLLLIDSRPLPDFRAGSLPGSTSRPVNEILGGIRRNAPDPSTEIVVHCAGITRGILGAHYLLAAGVTNPVSAMLHGTKGWQAKGYDLAVNQTSELLTDKESTGTDRAELASKLADSYALTYQTVEELGHWRQHNPQRTCYVVDVRSTDDFLRGHFPEAISIPGGELAGMTIDHVVTHGAHLCLIGDADTVDAEMTAVWMKHQGFEVSILSDWQVDLSAGLGTDDNRAIPDIQSVSRVSSVELSQIQAKGHVIILDVASSSQHEQGHIPGAIWISRASFPALCESMIKGADAIVVTSPTGNDGEFAAAELSEMSGQVVYALAEGTEAWRREGFEVVEGMQKQFGDIEDIDRTVSGAAFPTANGLQEQFQQYNAWRTDLYERYKSQDIVRFKSRKEIAV